MRDRVIDDHNRYLENREENATRYRKKAADYTELANRCTNRSRLTEAELNRAVDNRLVDIAATALLGGTVLFVMAPVLPMIWKDLGVIVLNIPHVAWTIVTNIPSAVSFFYKSLVMPALAAYPVLTCAIVALAVVGLVALWARSGQSTAQPRPPESQ
jgi:hypothetical protein